MLLISRIRNECPDDVRSGVVRTVGSTGGVITGAGLAFAASMFALLLAGISNMAQAGFIIGVGLLLDTFLMRTIAVPAMAVLVGRANWWPSRWRPQPVGDIRGHGSHDVLLAESQNSMIAETGDHPMLELAGVSRHTA